MFFTIGSYAKAPRRDVALLQRLGVNYLKAKVSYSARCGQIPLDDGVPLDERFRGYPAAWFRDGEPMGVCSICGRPRDVWRPCSRCHRSRRSAPSAASDVFVCVR